jgi:hypothetical protein
VPLHLVRADSEYVRERRPPVPGVLDESYRTPRGSRHRVVAYLGDLSKTERRGWARLAATLDGKAASKARQLFLFERPSDDDDPVPETIQVKTKGVRVERTRDFGDVYLALCLWRMLGLDDFFERKLPEAREEIPWHLTACALAVARFCEPSSELHVELPVDVVLAALPAPAPLEEHADPSHLPSRERNTSTADAEMQEGRSRLQRVPGTGRLRIGRPRTISP